MRIAIIGTMGIPQNYGGAEKCIEEVAPRLVKMGHEVTVYGSKGYITGKTGIYRGVNLRLIPYFHSTWIDFPIRRLLSIIDVLPRKFNVVHVWGADSAVYSQLLRICNIPTVITLATSEWLQKSYPRWVRWLYKITVDLPQTIDQIVVDNLPLGRFYSHRFRRKVTYIPYGSEIDVQRKRNDAMDVFGLEPDRYLLFVGRLLPGKGVDVLLRAFQIISEKYELPLVIVGGDTMGGKYQETLENIFRGNVNFLGPIYGPLCHQLYQNALLYISPSFLEGSSPAILEAMGTGNCVIAADIPMNKATLGKAGVFFEPGNYLDLAEKISLCLENTKQSNELRRLAVERVKKYFSWEKTALLYEKSYLQAIARN